MPAVSKQQQKLMGAALHCKRTGECASEKIKEIADSMSEKELEKYAGTKHKGLPKKVAENLSFRDFLMIEAMEENND